jgi:CheY-like chemotaxis protein
MPSRVLIIEDNPTSLELLTYLLRAFGHTVLAADDGQQGLDIAISQIPDLILCDMQLPTINGFQIIERVRDHPAASRIPVVAVTAFAMVGDRERVIAAGFDGYISKPIDPVTFVSQIETFLPTTRRQKVRVNG